MRIKKVKIPTEVKVETKVEVKLESPVGKFKPTGRFEVVKTEGGFQVVSPLGHVVSSHADDSLSLEDNHRKAKNFQEASNQFVRDSVHPDVWKKFCEQAKDQGLF